MKTASEYRAISRGALNGKWTSPVLTTLLYLVITSAVSGVLGLIPGVGGILSWFIVLPLSYAFACIFLKFYRTEGEEIQFGELFAGFTKEGYLRIFGTMLLMTLYTVLWTLLLIVPGIMKAYSYALTPYILKDEPELSYNAAIEKSMAMMEGHKMELFLLDMSFLGWMLLSILTLGIGLLWVAPYNNVARVAFYEDLKANA